MQKNNNKYYLGISDSHDAGICILHNDQLIYAINEERISRKKYQSGFPHKSISNFLHKFNVNPKQISHVGVAGVARTISDIPTNNDLTSNNGQIISSIKLMSFFSKFYPTKLFIKSNFFVYLYYFFFKLIINLRKKSILSNLKKYKIYPEKIDFFDHHECHVVSAFITSGFEKAIIFSNDGMGDAVSSKVCIIENEKIKTLSTISFYDSLAMIYGYASHLCNFKKNHHNGKTTGLAAYGSYEKTLEIFNKVIKWNNKTGKYENQIGVFRETLKFLSNKLKNFDSKDIASGIQKITDLIIEKQINYFLNRHNFNNICLVGGLHANVLTNSIVRKNNLNKNLFIFPNMGDGGLAVGSAGLIYKKNNGNFPRLKLNNYYLGDEFSDKHIEDFLKLHNINFSRISNIELEIAKLLANNKIIARFSGKLEYGPRALGNRSILYNAKDKSVNTWLNNKLHRTETMPFAPVVLYDYANEYIHGFKHIDILSAANMTITFSATDLCKKNSPAAVHIDGTLRPQVVEKKYNVKYYNILKNYHKITNIPLLINTSFNIHEEPIVRTPEQAYRAFEQSKLDYLCIENFLIKGNF